MPARSGRTPGAWPLAGAHDPQAYTVDSYLAAFEEIRRQVGAERWFVCGQSFGAGLVIQYALRHPERVPGLIFTNSLSAMTPKGNPDREAQQQQRIDAIKAGGREGLESIRIHPRHAKRLPEDAKRELVADAAQISLEGVIHSWQTTSPHLSIVDVLGQLPMPALLVNGLWEKRFQPMRDEAARLLPGLEDRRSRRRAFRQHGGGRGLQRGRARLRGKIGVSRVVTSARMALSGRKTAPKLNLEGRRTSDAGGSAESLKRSGRP